MSSPRSEILTRPAPEEGARHAAHLRSLNLERVLSVGMRGPGSFTRAQLIKATGLSAPTVGSLASHLIASGLFTDLGTGPSSGGRKPSFMEFNARHGFVAGIDLGPSKTRLAVADLRGEALAHRVVTTPSGLAPTALLSQIAGSVHELMREAQAPTDRLLAVGAGAPGAVDCERGIVALAPNLEGWSRVPMRDILQRALGAPVVVENDVNLAILGEHWRGAARGHDTCVFVLAGTGIGAGVLIGGDLHRGHHFMAGEIAVMCMGPQYADVDFGSRGCLETLAGLKALAVRWPQASEAEPARWVSDLVEAAHGGDTSARQAIDETVKLIGIAVANVSVVVDPSLIVLGGALFAQAEELVHDVRRIVGRITHSPIDIVHSALGTEAPLSGSLLVAATEARRQVKLRLREGRVTA